MIDLFYLFLSTGSKSLYKKKQLVLLVLFFCSVSTCFSQTDTSFWFAAPTVTPQDGNTPILLRLSSYGLPTDVLISEPANPSFHSYAVHLEAYSANTVDLTSQLNIVESKPGSQVLNCGLKIIATANISAYYEEGSVYSPEIFPLKGQLANGLKFMIPSQTTFNNNFSLAKNGYVVVATQDNTNVTITLSNDDSTHLAGSTFKVILNKGQTYSVRAADQLGSKHLGGSIVAADKPVSVTIYDDSIGADICRDLIGDQILPISNNSSEFIIVRGALIIWTTTQDYYYVWATSDNTAVTVNGSVVDTLNSGQCYTGTLTASSAYIVTSHPVYLYQMTGVGCEMASTNLPGIKCTGSSVVSFLRSTNETLQLNILCKATAIDSFLVNGISGIITASLFEDVPATNGFWKAARITSANLPAINTLFRAGITSVVSNTIDFFHLGFLNGESGTGARFGYFSDYQTVHASPIVASLTCEGSDIQLSTMTVQGATYQWYGPDTFTSTIYNPVIHNALLGNSGVYYLTANSKGCTSTDSVFVTIHPLPKVGFVLPPGNLTNGNVQFLDTSTNADQQNSFMYQWNFGDAHATTANLDTSAVRNPKHKYSTAGIYPVLLKVTTPNSCTDSLQQSFYFNVLSTANFLVTSLALLCSNDSITIQDASSVTFGSINKIKVYWDFANNPSTYDSLEAPLVNTQFFHVYPAFLNPFPKTFHIHYIAYSCAGSASVKDTVITINPAPKVQFSRPPGICNDADGRQIKEAIEIVGVMGDFTYTGKGVSENGMFIPKSAGIGDDTICVLYKTAFGCKDSATQSIQVWPLPIAKWGYGYPACEKNDLLFIDSSVSNFGKIAQWNWTFDNHPGERHETNTSFTKLYPSYGNYAGSLTVTTDSGCTSLLDSQVIKVHPLPAVRFSLPVAVCLPGGKGMFTDSTTIADQTQSLFSYRWNFGDAANPTPSTLKNPVHNFSAIGSYPVSLTVISQYGCMDSLKQIFSSIYPQSKADFKLSAAGLCTKDSIHLYDASSGYTGSVISWNWEPSEGNSSHTPNTFCQFPEPGTFPISLFIVDSKGCRSDTAVKSITINTYPQLSLVHTLSVLKGNSVQLKPDFYATTDASFSWTPSLYLNNSTIANPVITPQEDIQYKLIITGKGNCTTTDSVFIKVLPELLLPNTFSPNGDGINDTWVIKDLERYPDCQVSIFERGGQMIFKSVGYNTPWDGTRNGKPLPIGTYYYILDPRNGRALISGGITIIR